AARARLLFTSAVLPPSPNLPPVPAFYAKPDTIEDMVDHTVGRALDLFDIDVGVVGRWGEQPELRSRGAKREELS
ncbi:MAG: hypothetical protein ACLP8B_04745, partial [Xanthobacteraceae bacterium]